ncbi:TetR/AcrR family transcriptional regulator [uncultured Sphingomonas sp.]|uniref:TetR/AcrR family transcriptional regulator n=1 Tax=uncultured Sphingomonas sp. TaxID=158754 RepID=UPI002600458E|nr:TetR/AcrR family transcriptional regulator [uncultured Sphingomonas sp.]
MPAAVEPVSVARRSGKSEVLILRRTQEQRTAETRAALFAAAVATISRLGYSGASNAEIADEAGVSRGAITHHFATRAAFIAEVVRWVFEQEVAAYQQIQRDRHVGTRVSDWPAISWEVLSRPSGVAVLEIFVASRSDPELASLIRPAQQAIEEAAASAFFDRIGATVRDPAAIRLVVWAVRGMALGREFIDDPGSMQASVDLLTSMFARLSPTGKLEELIG